MPGTHSLRVKCADIRILFDELGRRVGGLHLHVADTDMEERLAVAQQLEMLPDFAGGFSVFMCDADGSITGHVYSHVFHGALPMVSVSWEPIERRRVVSMDTDRSSGYVKRKRQTFAQTSFRRLRKTVMRMIEMFVIKPTAHVPSACYQNVYHSNVWTVCEYDS